MDGLGGIAQQHRARRDQGLCQHRGDRIGAALAGAQETPDPPAEHALDPCQPAGLVQRGHGRGLGGGDTVDHAPGTVATRQQRGRAVPGEAFERSAIGDTLGAHASHEQDLAVIVATAGDPQRIAQGAAGAIGGSDQPRAQLQFAFGRGQAQAARGAGTVVVQRNETCGAVAGQARQLRQARFQRRAEIAGDHDLAEGLAAVVAGLQVHAAEVAGAADMDAPDRPARCLQFGHHAQGLECIDRGGGQAQVALVEHRRQLTARGRLHQGHIQRQAVQGDGQAGADQAATDNDHIVGSDHPLMIPARIAGPGLG